MTARSDIANAALVAIVQAERKAEKLTGRLGAIVRTHLETARLFAREARDEELAPGASDETAPITVPRDRR